MHKNEKIQDKTVVDYRSYVIQDGKLHGRFEDLYKACKDPWNQSNEYWAADKALILKMIEKLKHFNHAHKVLDIGCGLGHFSALVHNLGLDVTGIDISPTAIEMAKANYPGIDFKVGVLTDFDMILALKPDILLMNEITWYILQDLSGFLEFFRVALPETFLIHSLCTYPPNIQKYGVEFFTDSPTILAYFKRMGINIIECGEVGALGGDRRTFFLGKAQGKQS